MTDLGLIVLKYESYYWVLNIFLGRKNRIQI